MIIELAITKAEQLAYRAHQGQFRRDGVTPYIVHPVAVACAVPGRLKPIALLHDVLEDTDTEPVEIQLQYFDQYILDAIDALTRRNGEEYEDYLRRVLANPDALAVKVADIRHNLSDSPTEKQRVKYAKALSILEPPSRPNGEG